MWQVIWDWNDVCYSCHLSTEWQVLIFFVFLLLVFPSWILFKERKDAIEEGRQHDFMVAFQLLVPKIKKRIKLRFHILAPFFLVGGYAFLKMSVYTYDVLTDQYVDHEYNRLQARIEEGPIHCIQAQHVESYMLRSGKYSGDHYVKFDDGTEFYEGLKDPNRLCYGGGKDFSNKFYRIKEQLGSDQVEFKMCWVVDVDDKRSRSRAYGGQCIFEFKARKLE